MSKLVKKSRRLVLDGHVRGVDSARVFRVRGDHDTYTVVLWEAGAEEGPMGADVCTCPAPSSCSHILAARYVHQTRQEEIE